MDTSSFLQECIKHLASCPNSIFAVQVLLSPAIIDCWELQDVFSRGALQSILLRALKLESVI